MKDFNILGKTLSILLKKVVMLLGHILQSIGKWDSFSILYVLYLRDQLLLFKYFIKQMEQDQRMLHFLFRF